MLIALIPFDYLTEDLAIYKCTSSAWAMNGMVVTGHIPSVLNSIITIACE